MTKTRLRFIIAVLIFGLIVSLFIQGALGYKEFFPVCRPQSFSAGVIRHYIQGFGSWAVLIYILLYIVNTLTLISPIAVMSLSAGAFD